MNNIPDNIRAILNNAQVSDFIKNIKTLNSETKQKIEKAKKELMVPTLTTTFESAFKNFKRQRENSKDDYFKSHIFKLKLNQEAHEKLEVFCLSRGFTVSDFFVDLLYLLDHFDDVMSENPETTLKDFCKLNPLTKKLLGE